MEENKETQGTVVTEKPREFKARYEIVDGKKMLVVEAQPEIIIRPDGSQDVIMHVPSLDILNEFNK